MAARGIPEDMKGLGSLLDEDVRAYDVGTLPPQEYSALLEEVEQAVSAEPGPRERLAELPSPLRLALGVTGALGIAGAGLAIYGLRGDMAELDGLRMALSVAGLLAAATVAAALALRGPHRPPLRPPLRVVVAAVLLLPVISAAVPGAWEGMVVPAEVWGQAVLKCIGVGLPVSVAAGGVVLALMRWVRAPRSRLVLAGLSGGLMGFAAQQLHCPGADPLHLLLSHASLGLLAAAVLVGLSLIPGRASR